MYRSFLVMLALLGAVFALSVLAGCVEGGLDECSRVCRAQDQRMRTIMPSCLCEDKPAPKPESETPK